MMKTKVKFLMQETMSKCGFDASINVTSDANGPNEQIAGPIVWAIYSAVKSVFLEFPEVGFSQKGLSIISEEIARQAQSRMFYICTNSPTLVSQFRALKSKGILGKLELYSLEKFSYDRYRVVDAKVTAEGRMMNVDASNCIYDAMDDAMGQLIFSGDKE